jgi:hypothetical protein
MQTGCKLLKRAMRLNDSSRHDGKLKMKMDLARSIHNGSSRNR